MSDINHGNRLNNPSIILVEADKGVRDMTFAALKNIAQHSRCFSFNDTTTKTQEQIKAVLEEETNRKNGVLLVTGYKMPGGDAPALYNFLDTVIQKKHLNPDKFRIIGMTGGGDTRVHTSARAGLNNLKNVPLALLAKPFTMGKLHDAIKDILGLDFHEEASQRTRGCDVHPLSHSHQARA